MACFFDENELSNNYGQFDKTSTPKSSPNYVKGRPKMHIDYDTPPITKSVERKSYGMFSPLSVFEKRRATVRNLFGYGYDSPESPWGTGRQHYSDPEEDDSWSSEFNKTVREADISMDSEIPDDFNRTLNPSHSDLNRIYTSPESDINRTITSSQSNLNRTHTPPQSNLKRTYALPQINLNRTYTAPQSNLNITDTTPQSNLNRTHTLPQSNLNRTPTPPQSNLNRTDTTPQINLNRTYTPPQINLNRTYTPPQSNLNRTYTPPQSNLNRTVNLSDNVLNTNYISPQINDSVRKTIIYDSPVRPNLLKVDIDVFPRPLMQTDTGEQFTCDISLKMEEAQPQQMGASYDPVLYQSTPIKKSVDIRSNNMNNIGQIYQTSPSGVTDLYSPDNEMNLSSDDGQYILSSTPITSSLPALDIPNITETPIILNQNEPLSPKTTPLSKATRFGYTKSGLFRNMPPGFYPGDFIYYSPKQARTPLVIDYENTPPITKSIERKHEGLFTPTSVFKKRHGTIRNLFGDGYESPEPPWGTGRIHYSDPEESEPVPKFDVPGREADVSMAWEIPQSDLNKTFTPPQSSLNRTVLLSPKSPSITGHSIDVPSVYYALKSPLPARIAYFNKTPPITKSVERKHQGMFTPRSVFEKDRIAIRNLFGDGYESPEPPWGTGRIHYSDPEESAPVPEFDVPRREADVSMAWEIPQSDLNRTFTPPQGHLNRTFTPPQTSLNRTFTPLQDNLNRTFTPPQTNLNRAFSLPQDNLNRTLTPLGDNLNRTFTPPLTSMAWEVPEHDLNKTFPPP